MLLLDRTVSNHNLLKTIKTIDWLKYREQIELIPTQFARIISTNLIITASQFAPSYFYEPWISGDELGGIRAVWAKRLGCELRLIIPPKTGSLIYIYYQIENQYHIDCDVNGRVVGQYLQWLCTENYQKPEKFGNTTKVENALYSEC
jgi:hypothetical protein